MSQAKALVLFSGGLDSLLAAVILKKQGIAVEGVCFTSVFFSATAARRTAAAAGIPLREADIGEELLKVVKNPPHGYGQHMNPCIDCHALMIKRAGELVKERGCDFIATGEVLGQRPFSQNKDALKRIAKLAGTPILRPLSAKLLPPTEMEEQGLVVRHKLEAISGRSRERQFMLAESFKLSGYATPAGGCILTDPVFSERLLKTFDYWPDCRVNDVALLKYGRVFWLKLNEKIKNGRVLLLVGRKESDNEEMLKLAKRGDIVLELKEITGPTALLRGLPAKSEAIMPESIAVPEILKMSALGLGEPKSAAEIIKLASLLAAYYAVRARGRTVAMEYEHINK